MKIDIDKTSMIPVYEKIANSLRDMMYGGSLQDGDRLDSEQKMCRNLNVSRGTVRKAIDILLKEGMVKKIHGKGTFVSNPNVEYSLNDQLMSFAESLDNQHLSYTTQVIQQELRPATAKIADMLKIPIDSQYLYLERLRSVADDKLMLIENRINITLCPGIEKVNFNNISLFNEIEELAKRKISFARSTYEALTIGTERGKLLELPSSTPALKMQQTVYLSEKEPVEYGSVWLKGNKYFLTTTLQRR